MAVRCCLPITVAAAAVAVVIASVTAAVAAQVHVVPSSDARPYDARPLEVCSPPRPPRPPNTVLFLFRHGARSPTAPLTVAESWPWCDQAAYPPAPDRRVAGLDGVSPPPPLLSPTGSVGEGDPAPAPRAGSCVAGQLTARGAAQMVELGAGLRAAYGAGGSPGGEWRSVWVRSTAFSRTVDSAAYLLAGLFSGAKTTVGDDAPAASGAPRLPPIRVASPANETMFPNPFACPRLGLRFLAAAAATGRDVTVNASLWSAAAAATAAAGGGPPTALAASPSAIRFADVLKSNAAAGAGLPPGVSRAAAAVIRAAATAELTAVVGGEEGRRLAVGRFTEELLAAARASAAVDCIDGDKGEKGADCGVRGARKERRPPSAPHLRVYAAHDTTLWPMLEVLGARAGWPPFASSLAIEVYSEGGGGGANASVRVVYNGSPLMLPCRASRWAKVAPLSCLVSMLADNVLATAEVDSACTVTPP